MKLFAMYCLLYIIWVGLGTVEWGPSGVYGFEDPFHFEKESIAKRCFKDSEGQNVTTVIDVPIPNGHVWKFQCLRATSGSNSYAMALIKTAWDVPDEYFAGSVIIPLYTNENEVVIHIRPGTKSFLDYFKQEGRFAKIKIHTNSSMTANPHYEIMIETPSELHANCLRFQYLPEFENLNLPIVYVSGKRECIYRTHSI